MLFVRVLGVRVTYMLVISRVIPFIPELLPSEASKSSPSRRPLGVLHELFLRPSISQSDFYSAAQNKTGIIDVY